MTAPVDDRPPTSLRIGRVVTVVQAVAAAVIVGVALVYYVLLNRGADAADPDDYAGAVSGTAAFFAVVFGVLALALGVAAVGLCRSRIWALVTAGVTETLLILFVARPAVHGPSPVVWLLVIAPAVTVLVTVLQPGSRHWCRRRALA